MKPLIVGVGGSSGSIYAKKLLDRLHEVYSEEVDKVKVIISKNGRFNWKFELGNQDYLNYGFEVISSKDTTHRILRYSAADMIIAPCSMGLLGRIAHGVNDDLITELMDKTLQYRRHGIMIFRDKPLSMLHTQNILKIQQNGGLVIPATPSFYTGRESIDELALSVIDRALDHMGVPIDNMYRWGETEDERLVTHQSKDPI